MSSSSSPCAACKLLRRKCTQGCVFAPYFPPDQPARFANVHKVFGASNVSKLLNDLPQAQREDAVNSLAYEAEARLRDPVYGCVAYISILQHRIKMVREEIVSTRKELAGYVGQAAYAPFLPAQQPHHAAQFVPGMGLLQHPQQHQQQLMAAMHQQQQQQQQQQEKQLLQSPQEDDLQAMLMSIDIQGTPTANECYCPCLVTSTATTPDDVLAASVDEDDDDALWDSLWRLVDGDGRSSGGDSGEY